MHGYIVHGYVHVMHSLRCGIFERRYLHRLQDIYGCTVVPNDASDSIQSSSKFEVVASKDLLNAEVLPIGHSTSHGAKELKEAKSRQSEVSLR